MKDFVCLYIFVFIEIETIHQTSINDNIFNLYLFLQTDSHYIFIFFIYILVRCCVWGKIPPSTFFNEPLSWITCWVCNNWLTVWYV